MRAALDVRAVPDLAGRRIVLRWTVPPATAFDDARPLAGVRVMRRERTFPRTALDGHLVYAGSVVSELVDAGLAPLTTYYYRVFTTDGIDHYSDDASCASSLATDDYGLVDRLYKMLPGVHLRDDRLPEAGEEGELDAEAAAALAKLPARLRQAGPLRRFLEAAGAPFGMMRSTAEALPRLHDLDEAPPAFLPLLGQWIDWPTDRTQPVDYQRNEVRFAPRLYRTVGTAPNLRAIVNRYTGWYAQVAEFHQHIARSNMPPEGNVFSLSLDGEAWRASDDAASVLGFAGTSARATGTGSSPAVVTGTRSGPFALWPGAEITVTADERVPVTVRFGSADFADIAKATPTEVAIVLNRHLSEVTAAPSKSLAGALELRSNTVGPGSTVTVERPATSLVTLEGAPRGRLAAASDAGRAWLVYQATDVGRAPERRSSLRYKVLRRGTWSASSPLPGTGPQGDPALVALSPVDGRTRLLAVRVDEPGSANAQLRYSIGLARPFRPARLVGDRSAPFAIPQDGVLHVRVGGRSVGLQFTPSDTAYPAAATGTEVVAALNSRLRGVTARIAAGNRILLEATEASGADAIEVDQKASTAAAALGFGPANSRADADQGDGIDWAPSSVVPVPPGRHADLHAVRWGADGAILAWSSHDGTAWQIATTSWNGSAWGPTTELLTSGPIGHREPWMVATSGGDVWLLWSQEGSPGSGWCVRRRVRSGATGTWGTEAAITGHEPGRAGDRQPTATVVGTDLRVVFTSDRGGGRGLASLALPLASGAPGAPPALPGQPTALTTGPPEESWPTLFPGPTGLRLLHRSDRSVSLGGIGARSLSAPANRITLAPERAQVTEGSVRAPDTGTLRRSAGTTTLNLGDTDRIRRRRQWDDLIAYTPLRPAGGADEEPLRSDDLYTRGTVGLYLSRVVSTPLSDQMVDRLRSVLDRFLPVNTRAVVILAPRVDIELVYPPGADIVERFEDRHPDLEYLEGIGERASVALPGWQVLRAPQFPPKPAEPRSGGVSVQPTDPTSSRFRTWYPPPT